MNLLEGNQQVFIERCKSVLKEFEKGRSQLILNRVNFRGLRTRPTRWKTSDKHFLCFPIKGTCILLLDDGKKKIQLQPNELLYLHTANKFTLDTRDQPKNSRLWIYRCKFEFNPPLYPPSKGTSFFVVPKAESLRFCFDILSSEYLVESCGKESRVRGILTYLFGTCLRILSESETSPAMFTAQMKNLLERYVAAHPTHRFSPKELALRLRLSEKYFARLFKNTFGMSARHWLIHERMQTASTIFRTSTTLNISEIAQQLGYKNLALFSRQFKKIMKQSPNAFRKTLHGPAK